MCLFCNVSSLLIIHPFVSSLLQCFPGSDFSCQNWEHYSVLHTSGRKEWDFWKSDSDKQKYFGHMLQLWKHLISRIIPDLKVSNFENLRQLWWRMILTSNHHTQIRFLKEMQAELVSTNCTTDTNLGSYLLLQCKCLTFLKKLNTAIY